MMNAVPRVCPSCGTSLSIRDRRCPNPACGADEPFDMPAEEVGTTRIVCAEEPTTPYKTIAVGVGALLLVVALGHRPAEVLAMLRARLMGGQRDA